MAAHREDRGLEGLRAMAGRCPQRGGAGGERPVARSLAPARSPLSWVTLVTRSPWPRGTPSPHPSWQPLAGAAELRAVFLAAFRQPLQTAGPAAHPRRSHRTAGAAIAEGRVGRAAGAATADVAGVATGAVAGFAATGSVKTDLAGGTDRAVAALGACLRRVARLADVILTAALTDAVGADALVVVTGAAGAGGTTLVRACALSLRIAGGAERTAGGVALTLALGVAALGGRTAGIAAADAVGGATGVAATR
jgi:hypothetical protein